MLQYNTYQKERLMLHIWWMTSKRLDLFNTRQSSQIYEIWKRKMYLHVEDIPGCRSHSVMMGFFAHLLIIEYIYHHHNIIISSMYYPGPLHEMSSQSIYNCLSNVVHKQTNKQTNKHCQKQNLLCQGGNAKKVINTWKLVNFVLKVSQLILRNMLVHTYS